MKNLSYEIELEVFKGPMDLLLHLINKDELDIYDIPINIITEKYLEYIQNLESLDLELTSDFLVMAATLLEIKSKMLIPIDLEEMENEPLEDPRIELMEKLLEYKKFKSVADDLKLLKDRAEKIYYKPREDLSDIPVEIDLPDLNLEDLIKVFDGLIERKSISDTAKQTPILRDEYSIDYCIKSIRSKIKSNSNFSFYRLIGNKFTLEKIVTYFLAVLELIKNGEITAIQNENYTDIIINRRI